MSLNCFAICYGKSHYQSQFEIVLCGVYSIPSHELCYFVSVDRAKWSSFPKSKGTFRSSSYRHAFPPLTSHHCNTLWLAEVRKRTSTLRLKVILFYYYFFTRENCIRSPFSCSHVSQTQKSLA